jgi:hypothetical protein
VDEEFRPPSEDSFAKCRRIDPTAIGEIASRYDITAAE